MTARVSLLNASNAPAGSTAASAQIHAAFGTTPQMFRAVANSPAALQSMWGAFGALGGGVIPAQLGEKIAVAVADRNGCEYCLAAHTALGRKAGATAEEMAAAQAGRADDPRTAAALALRAEAGERPRPGVDADVAQLREVGFGDEEIVEIVAHVALNLFTNYINVALNVPVDFPGVKLNPR